jgi:hypothetical protein
MTSLRSLERWDHGFEYYSSDGYVCVRLFCNCGLRRADHLSREFYCLCEEETRAQQSTVESLMNELINQHGKNDSAFIFL